MLDHHAIVIIINIILISFAYIWFYPRVAADDIKKVLNYDLLTSITSLLIVGYFYSGSDVVFDLFGSESSWFWFDIVAFFIIETPFALWYFKKYDMWNKM